MPISFEELRTELTRPSVLGASPVQTVEDLLERRGGRVLPRVEASVSELEGLTMLSLFMSTWAAGSLQRIIVPTPKQMGAITFNDELGCWDRKASTTQPYGQLRMREIPNPSGLAHRTMYLVFFGTDGLPDGSSDFLDHVCERKSCCYPRHLQIVTHKENNRRGIIRAHLRPGEDHLPLF